MTHDFYVNGYGADNDGAGRWQSVDSDCKSPQTLTVAGARRSSAAELVSRDIYSSVGCNTSGGPFGIGRLEDIHRKHMRLWNGGWTAADGFWSVGTAHWDSDFKHTCGSYGFEATELDVVEAFRDSQGASLWFVQDIWQFPISHQEVGSTGGRIIDITDSADDRFEEGRQLREDCGTKSNVPVFPATPAMSPRCAEVADRNTRPGGNGVVPPSDLPDGCAYYIQLVA